MAPNVKSGKGEKQSSRVCLSWALNTAGICQATTREGRSAQSLHSTSGFGDSRGAILRRDEALGSQGSAPSDGVPGWLQSWLQVVPTPAMVQVMGRRMVFAPFDGGSRRGIEDFVLLALKWVGVQHARENNAGDSKSRKITPTISDLTRACALQHS